MAVENLQTTFTEVDPDGRLTLSGANASWAGSYRDEGGGCWKSYGADHFNALNIDFGMYVSSAGAVGSLGGFNVTNETAADQRQWLMADPTMDAQTVTIYAYGESPNWWRLVRARWSAVDSWANGADNTWYFGKKERTADSATVTVKIYSESAHTNLLDTLTVAGFSTSAKWENINVGAQSESASHIEPWTGQVQNIDLNEAVGISIPVVMHHRRQQGES